MKQNFVLIINIIPTLRLALIKFTNSATAQTNQNNIYRETFILQKISTTCTADFRTTNFLGQQYIHIIINHSKITILTPQLDYEY